MDWMTRTYEDTGVPGINKTMESISSGDPQVGRYHHISSYLVSSSYKMNTHSIFLNFWSHLLVKRFCGSAQLHRSYQLGSITSFHSRCTIHEPEQLFLTKCIWNTRRGVAKYWRWALCDLTQMYQHSDTLESCTSVIHCLRHYSVGRKYQLEAQNWTVTSCLYWGGKPHTHPECSVIINLFYQSRIHLRLVLITTKGVSAGVTVGIFLVQLRVDGWVIIWSFWRGFGSLVDILYIILLHWPYSCMKGCVQRFQYWH